MMVKLHLVSLILPLLAFGVAAGFGVLLLWEADAFEYSFLKVGDYVVRLAIPYRQTREAAQIAVISLAAAVLVGFFFAVAIFLLTRHLHRRISELATEREEQARRLEEVERMERFRREFVENVSHEIKTPLAAVMGAVEMLGGDVPLPEKERASFAHMRPKLGAWAAHIETARGIGYRLVL